MKLQAGVQIQFGFQKISCFISKNILSKVVLKYEVSMLTCPSTVHPAHPKIHFRIIRTVNPLSQRYINRNFQKYISVSICHGHRASFMRSLFIAFKNDEWCHFVVRIGSPIETPKWSFEEWVALQSLVINTTGLVQFGKNKSSLASQNYFQQNIFTKLIYQFLYTSNGYLLFTRLERVFQEERNENKEGNS